MAAKHLKPQPSATSHNLEYCKRKAPAVPYVTSSLTNAATRYTKGTYLLLSNARTESTSVGSSFTALS